MLITRLLVVTAAQPTPAQILLTILTFNFPRFTLFLNLNPCKLEGCFYLHILQVLLFCMILLYRELIFLHSSHSIIYLLSEIYFILQWEFHCKTGNHLNHDCHQFFMLCISCLFLLSYKLIKCFSLKLGIFDQQCFFFQKLDKICQIELS